MMSIFAENMSRNTFDDVYLNIKKFEKKLLPWKTLNYKIYSGIFNVLCNPEENKQNIVPLNDPKLIE